MRYSFNPFFLALRYLPARLYTFLLSIRNFLYDRKIFRIYRADKPLISVGNITVGGTGKTPFVAYLCHHYRQQGKKVVVVSRGYGGKKNREVLIVSDGKGAVFSQPEECGDEPFLLAHLLPDVPVLICRKRSLAIQEAVRMYGPDLIILDDGYQHRAVFRDADILLIDATDPFGNYRVLPAGILREPIRNIERAGIIVITRAEKGEEFLTLEKIAGEHNPKAILFTSGHRFSSFMRVEPGRKGVPPGMGIEQREIGAEPADSASVVSSSSTPSAWAKGSLAPSDLQHKKVFAFCGIGNPGVFLHDLERLGAEVVGSRFFRDHHRYSPGDVREIEEKAIHAGAELLVTTHKDAVRMRHFENPSLPVYYASIEVVVHQEDRFFSTLETCLSGSRRETD